MTKLLIVGILIAIQIVAAIKNVEFKHFPRSLKFAVRLEIREKFCSGFLLLPNWIVTVAHCVWDIPPEDITAHFGSATASDQVPEQGITVVLYHEDYNQNERQHNIALLKLMNPVNIELVPHRFVLVKDQFKIGALAFDGNITEASLAMISWIGDDVGKRRIKLVKLEASRVTVPDCQPFNQSSWDRFCMGPKLADTILDTSDVGSPVFILDMFKKYVLLGMFSYVKMIEIFMEDVIPEKLEGSSNFYVAISMFSYLDWFSQTIRQYTKRKEIAETYRGLKYFKTDREYEEYMKEFGEKFQKNRGGIASDADLHDGIDESTRRDLRRGLGMKLPKRYFSQGTFIKQMGADGIDDR